MTSLINHIASDHSMIYRLKRGDSFLFHMLPVELTKWRGWAQMRLVSHSNLMHKYVSTAAWTKKNNTRWIVSIETESVLIRLVKHILKCCKYQNKLKRQLVIGKSLWCRVNGYLLFKRTSARISGSKWVIILTTISRGIYNVLMQGQQLH